MKIGKIDLGERPVMLAPMEDVTDLSFRQICREQGADMVYTEFVSADALIRNIQATLRKLNISQAERPAAIQIYGREVAPMVEAAKMCAEVHPDVIDLNFGCPVKKVAGKGAGSGLLRNVPLMCEITRAVVDAVDIPVTAKTRLGWDCNSKHIVEVAEQLQDCGIQALTIHGRTRSQMYTGEADWTLIGEVKNNPRMHIPIIGNGDVTSAEIAKEQFDRWGVDGIMVGRASFGHPWIFREMRHYLDTGELLPPMSVNDRVVLAKRHLALSLQYKGDVRGIFEMRRHLSCYFKGLQDFKDTRIKLVTSMDVQELYDTLDYVSERWGGEPLETVSNVYNV